MLNIYQKYIIYSALNYIFVIKIMKTIVRRKSLQIKFREFTGERSVLNTEKHSRVYRSSIRDSNGVQTSFRVRKIDESLEPAPNYLSIVLRGTGEEGNPVDKNVALERGHRIEINVS